MKNKFWHQGLSTGLASMMIGLSFFRLKNQAIVKADLQDQKEGEAVAIRKSQPHGREFIKLGRIIPVNGQRRPLPNAPRPQYRRDPNDPGKALPTPIPSIAGYRPAKYRQAANYNPQTKLVTPPANPAQDTWLVYELAKAAPMRTYTRPYHRYGNYQTVRQASSPSQVKERVTQTKLFGFGRKKKEKTSSPAQKTTATSEKKTGLASALQQQTQKQQKEGQSSSLTKIQASGSAGNLQPQSRLRREAAEGRAKAKTKKRSAKSNKEQQQPKKGRTSAKPPVRKKPRPPKPPRQMARPAAVLNKETKIPPKPLLATLQIVDNDRNQKILTKLSAEGQPGDKIRFPNLAQVLQIHAYDGYEFIKARNETDRQDLPATTKEKIDFGQFGTTDVSFAIFLRHRVIKVDAHSQLRHLKSKDVKLPVTLTVHYTGAGEQTPADKVEHATWTRARTYDQVTHQVLEKGKFDTPWRVKPTIYPAVATPQIRGYKPDLEEVVATPVQQIDLRINITYQPVSQPVGQPFDQQEPQKPEEPQKQQEPQKLIKVDALHPFEKVAAAAYQKTTTFTVRFTGAGERTPAAKTEKASWQRSVTADQEGNLIKNGIYDTDWQSEAISYPQVSVPVVPGYHTQQRIVPGPNVSLKNISREVAYAKNGQLLPINEQGQVIGSPLTIKTDPHDPTQAQPDQAIPKVKGYETVKSTVTPPAVGEDLWIEYRKAAKKEKVQAKTPAKAMPSKAQTRAIPTKPAASKAPVAKPAVTEPAATKPAPTEPAATKLAVTEPIAAQSAVTQPKAPKPARTKAKQTQPAKPQPAPKITKPVASKAAAPKPAATKPVSTKPVETEPAKVKKQATQPAETEPQATKPAKKQAAYAAAGTALVATEIVHFVDQAGRQLHADEKRTITFHRQDQKWQRPVDRFPLLTVPVVEGYYADQASVAGRAFMPVEGKKNQTEITVTYRPFAEVIPIDKDGRVITNPASRQNYRHAFINDPRNAARALPAQKVGAIPGWEASVKTITPADPNVDIPVTYRKTEGKRK